MYVVYVHMYIYNYVAGFLMYTEVPYSQLEYESFGKIYNCILGIIISHFAYINNSISRISMMQYWHNALA